MQSSTLLTLSQRDLSEVQTIVTHRHWPAACGEPINRFIFSLIRLLVKADFLQLSQSISEWSGEKKNHRSDWLTAVGSENEEKQKHVCLCNLVKSRENSLKVSFHDLARCFELKGHEVSVKTSAFWMALLGGTTQLMLIYLYFHLHEK